VVDGAASFDEARTVLNDAQKDRLADFVNAKINIPLVGEGTEKTILLHVVKQLDAVLSNQIGEQIRGILAGLVDGTKTGEEAAAAKAEAVALLNAKINLPVVGEDTEAMLLGHLVDGLVVVLRAPIG
jgi:hypothetical protein